MEVALSGFSILVLVVAAAFSDIKPASRAYGHADERFGRHG